MPYKTIQQNFANGELNPKMQGRADVDMYYKSAQKMRDVVTTPYGGFVRRPGSKVIYQGGNGLTSLSGMEASTQITADETNSIDKVADLNLTTYAVLTSSETMPAGTKLVTVTPSQESGTTTINYRGWTGYTKKFYAWEGTSGTQNMRCFYPTETPQVGEYLYYYVPAEPAELLDFYTEKIQLPDGNYMGRSTEQGALSGNAMVKSIQENAIVARAFVWGVGTFDITLYRRPQEDVPYDPTDVFTLSTEPSQGDTIYSDTNGTPSGMVSSYYNGTMYQEDVAYTRNSSLDVSKTIEVSAEPKKIKRVTVRRISSTQEQELELVGQVAGLQQTLKVFSTSSEEQSFYVNTDSEFESVSIITRNEGTPDLTLYELELFYENESAGTLATRLIPFVFNNDQTYLISITYKTIKIFRNDTLVATVPAGLFTNEVIKNLRFAQTADTLILVHPDMPPQQLVRGETDSSWTLSNFPLTTIPYYDFEEVAPTSAGVSATPNELDGTVKITLSGTISANLVGQYMEGNGGRVKITSQNGTTLTGYTVIGFYSTDAIGANTWTYTTSYEPVWSNTRGWPCSVTFHGGRLWFGGSKSRPQTVWGSKVGLFNKFDPTSGYDNDAIEFTLDTAELNRITDIYSQKNLLIFTLGGEFVCSSSYNEPITPNNVNAIKQTSNGSWEKTRPVDIEGSVMFVERKGQGLMAFAASDNTTDIYNTSNSSLINSHLINSPVDIAVERNNLTQQTNYVYIVNDDGTLCVVNLLASQGITGGYTLWRTQGKYKNICVLPDATYVIVSREQIRGDVLYLEKLDFDALCDGTMSDQVNGTSYTDGRFANKKIDMFMNNQYKGSYLANDEGEITFPQTSGYATFGISFRWEVESNFLEIPQLGVGLNRKKRLATMTVRTLDTPELTVNGETQPGGEGIKDIEYYGIGDWSEHPTWIMQEQRPCKVNVMAVQMNVNYQVAGDEY